MVFSEQLFKFLRQAKTNNLKTKHFLSSYQGLKVSCSFGQGTPARIPWISFLKSPNTTSNGIYPGYLFFKNIDKLILTYGVSETNRPKEKWNIISKKTVKEYFFEKGLGTPSRYGDSYIFKVYDTNNLPDSTILDKDLYEIIDVYLKNNSLIKKQENSQDFDPIIFYKDLEYAGLLFSRQTIDRLISSLITKPFVILTGLSGSGKTKLAQAFVSWICRNESQYCIIPVGADWTNRDPLLGYPNGLNSEEYIKPDNGALDVIIKANANPDLPHFIILDEMNLSHVERYFADFLSVMESNKAIPLHTSEEALNGVPARLDLPANLFIIGTVNIDETTYMFSPKVLDRANTIEFRISEKEIEAFLGGIKEIDMAVLESKGADMADDFLGLARNKALSGNEELQEVSKVLVDFFRQLKKAGAEFGYRSASEIIVLIKQLGIIAPEMTKNEKIDIAVMQKLLPKLHGSRRKLSPVLKALGGFCITEAVKDVEKEVFAVEDFEFNSIEQVKYPLSLEKITRMHKGVVDNGFASYAEA